MAKATKGKNMNSLPAASKLSAPGSTSKSMVKSPASKGKSSMMKKKCK